MAKVFEIGHEMANLASVLEVEGTFSQPTRQDEDQPWGMHWLSQPKQKNHHYYHINIKSYQILKLLQFEKF